MRKIVQCSIMAVCALAMSGCMRGAPLSPTANGTEIWRSVDASTGQIDGIAELRELAVDFPDSGSVRLRLANALLQAGDMSAALAEIAWLSNRGYQFSEGAQQQLLDIFQGSEVEALRSLFAAYGPPIEASEVVDEVPLEAQLVEGIVIEPGSNDLAVTAVVSREVWRVRDGQWKSFPYHHLGNVSGVVFDPFRGAWLASGDLGMIGVGEDAFSGLVLFYPDAIEGVRFPAPEGVQLADIAWGRGGTIYASDPIGGGVYRLLRGEGQIAELVPPGILRSPQGLAESLDGQWLYVSDYRYGLAAIALASGEVHRITTHLPVLLDGIDALVRDGSKLVAIQNGSSPMQIVALELGADGLSITGHRVLERAHPDWTEPLGAAIHDGRLYYVATGQWESFVEGGELAEGAELLPTKIRSLPLDRAEIAETP